MPENTPRLGLTVPIGTDSTNIPGAFSTIALQLDTVTTNSNAMMAFASGSTLPAAGTSGRIFYDGTQLWFDTGSAWLNMGGNPPVGSMILWSTSVAPGNYVNCDGSAYSTTGSYPSGLPGLFSVVGYSYGGGGGSFNVPDFRSRFPVGQGVGPGLSEYLIGQEGGEEQYTNSYGVPLPTHNHTISSSVNDPLHGHPLYQNGQPSHGLLFGTAASNINDTLQTAGGGEKVFLSWYGGDESYIEFSNTGITVSSSSNNAGSGGDIDIDVPTIPPYETVNVCIRFQ